MRNIERYIVLEIVKPLAAVLGILILLFASFSSARYLAAGITQTLGLVMMLKLVLLKTLIALEVLIPISFYVSIVIGLGRLHRDQEIVALRAAGVNGLCIVRAVLLLAVPVAVLVGALSISGRPWAYELSYLVDARADADLNTDRFQPGRFYGNEENGRVIYIQDKTSGTMQQVFHYLQKDAANELIVARQGRQFQQELAQRGEIHLLDGMIYRLSADTAADEVIRFEKMVTFLEDPEDSIGYKRKAANTLVLLQSEQPMDVAELQWRLSRPFSTILLALLAVPLSRSSARQGKNEKIFTAALAFAIYYNLSGLARSWVEQGVVAQFPGVWWLQALLLIVVLLLLSPELRSELRPALRPEFRPALRRRPSLR